MISPSLKAIRKLCKRAWQLFELNSPPSLELQVYDLDLQPLVVLPYRSLKRDLPTYFLCSLLPTLASTRMPLDLPVSVARLLHLRLPLLSTLGRVNQILDTSRAVAEHQLKYEVRRSASLSNPSQTRMMMMMLQRLAEDHRVQSQIVASNFLYCALCAIRNIFFVFFFVSFDQLVHHMVFVDSVEISQKEKGSLDLKAPASSL